jgi:hypothetical protein
MSAGDQRTCWSPKQPFGVNGCGVGSVSIASNCATRDAGPSIDWLRDMPARAGAVGTYRFDRYGDTTQRTFGVYRVRGGALEWAGAPRCSSTATA